MAKAVRLAKVAREINVGIDTIAAHLRKKGFSIDVKPTTKLTGEMHELLLKDFRDQIALKERADKIQISFRANKTKAEEESVNITTTSTPIVKTPPQKTAETELLVTSHANSPTKQSQTTIVNEEKTLEKEINPSTQNHLDDNIVTEQKTSTTQESPAPKEVSSPKEEETKVSAPSTIVKATGGLSDEHTQRSSTEKEEVSIPQEQPTKASVVAKLSTPEDALEKQEAKAQKDDVSADLPKQEQPITPVSSDAKQNVEDKPELAPIVEKTILPKKQEDIAKDNLVKPATVDPKQESSSTTSKAEQQPEAKTDGVAKAEQIVTPKPQEETKLTPTPIETTKQTQESTAFSEPEATSIAAQKTPSKPTSKPTADSKLEVGTKQDDSKIKTKPTESAIADSSTIVKKDEQKSTAVSTTPSKNIPPTQPTPETSDNSSMITEVDKSTLDLPKVVGKINLSDMNLKTRPEKRKDRKSNQRNRDRRKDRRDDGKSREGRAPKRDQKTTSTPTAKITPKRDTNTQNKQQEQKRQEKKPTPPLPTIKPTKPVEEESNRVETVVPQLQGPKIIGKIELPITGRGKKKSDKESAENKDNRNKRKRRRKRIVKTKTEGAASDGSGSGPKTVDRNTQNKHRKKVVTKRNDQRGRRRARKAKDVPAEVSEKEIQEKIKATMAKLSGGAKGKSSRAKLRRQKREQAADKRRMQEAIEESNILQLTEFISVSELAKLMDTAVNNVITTCFNLGIIVSINQRLDAEVIELVTEEFGYEVEFISATEEGEEEEEIVDAPEDLKPRSPIVTIMGHVDHGKTSLLDYIRNANVVGGEMGGITQHIGAYEVRTESGNSITFLDTPGHEAFTAMRARGAKVTDVAVIVVAADDSVMPQTKEAISHAQAAGVPMVFAINKIDKPDANPDRIKEQLAAMNILVEDWGGKYQSQEVSAKSGLNIEELLEKIALEAEMLELKANPDRAAVGTVIEASLDKGRGYVTTVLVQAGTLKIGDIVLGGQYTGRVKAMFNERGKRVKTAGPSQPVLLLGLNGAPQAGDRVKVMTSEQEARGIAQRRKQLVREQQQRASKHITLEEIGRRLALGNFKELNLIVKGDVDGSVEALSDSLLKLSTEEIQVRIIHRAVGPIIGSDVLLASASDAIIIGFQVRPTLDARRQAEQESIDIRMYSIIYDAIEEIKSAMEGMLEPTVEERFVCNVEVKDTFKVSKVGTIAGCYVAEGRVYPDTKIRLVRDGIVVYTGEIDSLKRYKDDVKEVLPGQECGIAIKNFNDIKVGDIIEGYEEVKIKRTLADVRK